MDNTIIPNGTIVVALQNVTMADVWPPIIYAGDELRVLGYVVDRTENGVPTAVDVYRVETHRKVQMYVKPEDIQVKELLPPKDAVFNFQQGTSAYAKHSVWMETHPNRPKILSENERVYIKGTLVRDGKAAYYVKNNAGMELIVLDEVLSAVPHYPVDVSVAIQKAFREGYSRGHSRGANQQKFYGGDSEYSVVIQAECSNYLKELDDESNR